MTAPAAPAFDPAVLRAWYVVKGFGDAVGLCICGTVDHAFQVVYETLARYPDEAPSQSPGQDRIAVFAAYVLDSWDLLTHNGSIDAGTVRSEKGEILFQAMRTLEAADADLLPDVWMIRDMGEEWDPPGSEVPWWLWGNER